MSYRIFCDVCGKETKDQADRLRRILGAVMIEVMVRFENTWNAGHVCDACILRVVNEGRPARDNESWIADQIAERKERA